MDEIDATLSTEQLANLRGAYSRATMIEILSSGMPSRCGRTGRYIDAIGSAFYGDGADTVAPKDRERCLIAILASRDAGLNLSLHIYLGLMEGLSPREIADIVFLAGIYTGVDRLSDGLAALVATLGILAKPPKSCKVVDIVGALLAAFGPPWLPPPKPK
jgi:alkylhydroperoxidase/carboxymuconolactone decarboxylase family protein YurZ